MTIELCNVCKKFKKTVVLHDISLKFTGGLIYGLEGRNGSGKSVLLKIIAGLYMPTIGEVYYNQKKWNSKKKCPVKIRAFIEKPSFFPGLSGYENLKLLADIEKSILPSDILKALDVVGLSEEKDKKFNKYSLGMKQKLGIAQAIMEESDLLILDEPFNGIDEVSLKNLKQYILNLKNEDKIIIITSHIAKDLSDLCDVLISVQDGCVMHEVSK